jgi:hypothetical protein
VHGFLQGLAQLVTAEPAAACCPASPAEASNSRTFLQGLLKQATA